MAKEDNLECQKQESDGFMLCYLSFLVGEIQAD